MTHEKIFKRDDGSKVKITVRIMYSFLYDVKYSLHVMTCGKRKRKFQKTFDYDDYEYRKLGDKERTVFAKKKYLEHATKEEIDIVASELLEKIKPSFDEMIV
ncbi:MAG: hypothetical protein OEL54_05290 [Flavobacteriaceae bacterium]|nr:hypothetical protein [Flavobacteriaceae bacterium]